MSEGAENRQYSGFERSDEFLGYLSDFLNLDLATEPTASQNETEDALLVKLSHIVGAQCPSLSRRSVFRSHSLRGIAL
jgi:hypothetical protein